MKTRRPTNNAGSVLIEGTLCLFLFFLGFVLNLELCRRVWFSTTIHFGAFDWLRTQVLDGGTSLANSRLKSFIDSSWSGVNARWLLASLDRELTQNDTDNWGSRFHIRYPSLLRLRVGSTHKHHFEVTEKCRFPYSY